MSVVDCFLGRFGSHCCCSEQLPEGRQKKEEALPYARAFQRAMKSDRPDPAQASATHAMMLEQSPLFRTPACNLLGNHLQDKKRQQWLETVILHVE